MEKDGEVVVEVKMKTCVYIDSFLKFLAAVRAGPGKKSGPPSWSPTWVAQSWTLGPSFIVFPDKLAGSWIDIQCPNCISNHCSLDGMLVTSVSLTLYATMLAFALNFKKRLFINPSFLSAICLSLYSTMHWKSCMKWWFPVPSLIVSILQQAKALRQLPPKTPLIIKINYFYIFTSKSVFSLPHQDLTHMVCSLHWNIWF